MKHLLILSGPNLNLLGIREPDQYGHDTLNTIHIACEQHALTKGYAVQCVQSNHEGVLVDQLHASGMAFRQGLCIGVVLNAGAYTHTSIALHDAIRGTELPVVECHLSNTHRREPFRHHSYLSSVAIGVIMGFGAHSYRLAVDALIHYHETQPLASRS